MAFHFFAPKTLGSIGIGGGVLSGGGVIYWYQIPRTWKELLTKEGFIFLSSEEDYKGMFHDQKNENIWKTETSLSSANDTNVKSTTEKYCQSKFQEALPSGGNYEATKQKLIAFCTSDGIKSVKGRLIQNNKKNWIEDSEEDKWKVVFAIYRYEPTFIDWLKEDADNSSLSSSSNVSEWEKLKKACTNLLAKPYRELSGNKYFEYASWWCIDLGYKTVKEKIEKDSSWQQETESSKIKNRWKDTTDVVSKIKSDLSKGDSEELQDSDYKKWCDEQLKKELKENDYYQEKYLMIKSVCRKVD